MGDRAATLSPRQRDCLRLVWERQATSKEIAADLGIGKGTVDGYIADAVVLLGARDRRDAAIMAFGAEPRRRADAPPAQSGGDPAGVAISPPTAPSMQESMQAPPASRPWRGRDGAGNSLTLAQTLGWIAVIAIGSLVALSLAASVGDGLPRVAMPTIQAVHRLTQ